MRKQQTKVGFSLRRAHISLISTSDISAWFQPQQHHLHGLSVSSSGCPVIVSPTGRRPVGGAFAPVADLNPGISGWIGSGVWGFTHRLSGAWQGRNGDHVSGKGCSGLDLLGCDPGSGYAARGFNTRETELAYRSLLLRDDARAASSSSPVVCRIVGAPPLGAPARVFPGRTLVEGEGRVGSRASPQVQSTPLFRWRWPAGVPVSVPCEPCSGHPCEPTRRLPWASVSAAPPAWAR